MNKSILLATVAVLLVAGCTQGGIQIPGFQQITTTAAGGAGLVMSDFSVDQPTIFGGSTDRIMMTVKNAGGYDVPDASSLVFLTGSAIDFTKAPGVADPIYWVPGSASDKAIEHFGKTMKSADIVSGTSGDEKTITWNLKAPNITSQTRNDLFIGRVYSDYQTVVTGTVWVYSQTEADAARAAKRSIYSSTFSSTSGPVALTASVSPDPIVLQSNGDTFTMKIRISSVGGGTLYQNNTISYGSASTADDLKLSDTNLNKVVISVIPSSSNLAVSNPADCTGEQELIGGKDVVLSCDIVVTTLPATFQSYPVTVTAYYGYFTERTASITVQKR
jgi:hypothetical protein